MVTSMGQIEIEVFQEQVPITTANFKSYVEAGHYDGKDGKGATQFHRVIAGFMVQGGGLTAEGTEKATQAAIKNEATMTGLANKRGTVAMARTSDPDSATAQFFINVVDNGFLDPSAGNAGYAVFGRVTSGMDVVDLIAGVETDPGDQPKEPIVIMSLTIE